MTFTLQVATPADGSLLLPGVGRGTHSCLNSYLLMLHWYCRACAERLAPASGSPFGVPLSDMGVLGQWQVGASSSTRTADHHPQLT